MSQLKTVMSNLLQAHSVYVQQYNMTTEVSVTQT